MNIHERFGWDTIHDGSWKKSKYYNPPWHWKRRLCAFLGIHLYMRHRFDVRELFIIEKDFIGDFHFPTYKECLKRVWAVE